jgi:hypothetical protein
VRKSGFGEQSFIAEMRQMMWRTREMAILPIGADSGTSSFSAGTSTIRLKISYLDEFFGFDAQGLRSLRMVLENEWPRGW